MPYLTMPPRKSQSARTTKRGQRGPHDESGPDRNEMPIENDAEVDANYHNLPEISWNTETFNFDAGDFTNQDNASMMMRTTNQHTEQVTNVNSVQPESEEQAEMTSGSLPKKALRPCSHCGKTFSRSYDLNRHESSHSDERRFACEYPGCNKRYKLRQDLKAHERSAHEGRGGGGAVVLGHWRGYEDRLYSM